ncbi:Ms4533A family Cys-rich leader peptide [Streptomyces sp. NPDC092370]|uniref:Ms4533A family Cys-rich leader peptide n=1 Tax=Streptomyces sp. NPDC092370 TaxID=3366016 RepID=UPI0037FE8519
MSPRPASVRAAIERALIGVTPSCVAVIRCCRRLPQGRPAWACCRSRATWVSPSRASARCW